MLKGIIIFLFAIGANAQEAPPKGEPPYPGDYEELQDVPPTSEVKKIQPQQRPEITRESLRSRRIHHPLADQGLYKITKKGEYLYKNKTTEKKHGASFRLGVFSPPAMQNPNVNITFKDVYGSTAEAIILFDYEWQFNIGIGKLGIALESGFYQAKGKGRFADGTQALEEYTFFAFPNGLSARYHMKFWDKQWLVPYGAGGINYFTFVEQRNDNSSKKFGGSLASHFAGGLALMIDALDPDGVIKLDRTYGINHIYLTGEYRQYVGINKTYDFTSNAFNGGFYLEF